MSRYALVDTVTGEVLPSRKPFKRKARQPSYFHFADGSITPSGGKKGGKKQANALEQVGFFVLLILVLVVWWWIATVTPISSAS